MVPILAGPNAQVGPSNNVGIGLFGSKVPVPMVVPGRVYGGDVPWFYTEQ